MKRKEVVALFFVGVMISGLVTALAVNAGSASDPLISLEWVKSTFLPNTLTQSKEVVDSRLDALSEELLEGDSSGVELRVKQGDMLRLESGSGLTHLAGELSLVSDGAVIDITAGEELTSGVVPVAHRYLADDKSQAVFFVVSDTAVIRLTGSYQITLSEEMDYNAMATALKSMGLFQGSDVAYGSGYELEVVPTRIQGLIMFLRLLGEENAALTFTGSDITFADVPDWALPYVAYAYDKGYTKGQQIDEQWRVVFGSSDPLTPNDYLTFLLRVFGYTENVDFQWLTAIADAEALGVLTSGEVTLLTEKPFLRAQVVYLSYVSLSVKLAGEDTTLFDHLAESQIFDASKAREILSSSGIQRY